LSSGKTEVEDSDRHNILTLPDLLDLISAAAANTEQYKPYILPANTESHLFRYEVEILIRLKYEMLSFKFRDNLPGT